MTIIRTDHWFAVVAVVALSGCASAAPHHADVERRVQERAGAAAFEGDVRRLGAKMTADDVVAVALARNAGLRARLRDVDTSVGQWVTAGAVGNPHFELEASIPVGDSDGSTAIEMALLQELNTFLELGSTRRAAKMDLERTKVLVTSAVLELGAEAREATWRYAAARKLAELRSIVVEATDASYEVSLRLFEAGNVSRLEVAQGKATREQARLDLRRAQRGLVASREAMNRVMGLHGDAAATWELGVELPEVPATDPMPLADLESAAVGASLALEADRLGLEGAVARGRATAFGAWPHVAVGVFTELEPADGFTAVGPALEVSLPLWSFGRGRIMSAKSNLLAAQSRYTQAAVELRSDVRGAREDLAEAGDRARFLKDELLPLRREITQETLKRYNAMHVGVFELLLAKEAEIDSVAQWVEASRDYWVARTRVELLLQGGPAMPMSPDASATRRPETMSGGH